ERCRLAPRRLQLSGYEARRNTQCPTKGNAEMREVPTHARSELERVSCRCCAVTAAGEVVDLTVDPVADLCHPAMPWIKSAELAPGETGQFIRLAVAAREEEGDDAHRQMRNRNLVDRLRCLPMRLNIDLRRGSDGHRT